MCISKGKQIDFIELWGPGMIIVTGERDLCADYFANTVGHIFISSQVIPGAFEFLFTLLIYFEVCFPTNLTKFVNECNVILFM